MKSDTFLITGRAHVLLTLAFSKLPNLACIGVRDYDARGRRRDGENASWRSYGWSLNPTEQRFRSRMSSEPLLPLLLYSLGEASTGPERIEMFLRRDPVPDRSFDLSPSFMQSKAVPVLSNLRALLLSLDGHWGEDFDSDMHTVPNPSNPDSGFGCLRRFLQHTPLLEHIRLNFKYTGQGVHVRHADALLAWLGTSPGPDVNMIPTPVRLDHLTTLELGMIVVAPDTLLDLVSKFAKLEAVSLWKVELQPVRDSSEEGKFEGQTMWAYYLRKIGEAFQAPENVKTFMIGWVVEDMSAMHVPVRFAGKIDVDGNGKITVEDVEDVVKFRKEVGSNVRSWLDGLAKKVFLQEPIEILSDEDPNPEEWSEDDEDDGTPDESEEDEIDDDASVDTETAAAETGLPIMNCMTLTETPPKT